MKKFKEKFKKNKLLYKFTVHIKHYKNISKLKKKYKNLIYIINPPGSYYSQKGQDYIIYNNFFSENITGIYCDVGANHPRNLSNTLYFEEKGWRGIAFEPLPQVAEKWRSERTGKLIQVALSDSEGTEIFRAISGDLGWENMLSFIPNSSQNINVDYANQKYEEISVSVRALKNILLEEDIECIDYLSIDVEGHELQVLRGIDFTKVKIKIISIENNNGNSPVYGSDEIREFLISKGFNFWARIHGLDDIFVNGNYE